MGPETALRPVWPLNVQRAGQPCSPGVSLHFQQFMLREEQMSSSHLLRPPRNFGVHLLLLAGQEKKGDDVTKHVIVRPAARCVFSTTALWPQSGPEAVFLLHFGGDEVVPLCGGGHSIEKHLAVFAKKNSNTYIQACTKIP